VRTSDGDVEYVERTATAVFSVPGPGADVLSLAAGPVEILRFGLALGETAVLFDRTLNVDLNADGRVDSVDVRVDSSFVAVEAVTTAAGVFSDAAHVRTVLRSTVRVVSASRAGTLLVTADEWFVPGIGPVRSSVVTVTDGVTAPVDVEDVVA
jgi:hypothetical protein